MGLLSTLFGSSGDDVEFYEDHVERELTVSFTRRTVEFTFVRGKSMELTYDVFDGRITPPEGHGGYIIKSITNGVQEAERNGVRVERLCRVDSAVPHRYTGENILRLHGEVTHEVTTANVSHRTVVSEKEMEVAVPVKEKVYRHPDTHGIERRWLPRRTGETEIREMEG